MKEVKAYVHRSRVADVIAALKDCPAWGGQLSGRRHNLSVYLVKGSIMPLDSGEQHYSMDLGDEDAPNPDNGSSEFAELLVLLQAVVEDVAVDVRGDDPDRPGARVLLPPRHIVRVVEPGKAGVGLEILGFGRLVQLLLQIRPQQFEFAAEDLERQPLIVGEAAVDAAQQPEDVLRIMSRMLKPSGRAIFVSIAARAAARSSCIRPSRKRPGLMRPSTRSASVTTGSGVASGPAPERPDEEPRP